MISLNATASPETKDSSYAADNINQHSQECIRVFKIQVLSPCSACIQMTLNLLQMVFLSTMAMA